MTQTVPDQKRAKCIANIRQLADWMEANPDVPAPVEFSGQKQMADPGFRDGISAAEGLARVRSFAAQHGVKVDESSHDRTSAEVRFGIARYSLLTWHKDGRPGQPDERDAELERLRAELASLKGQATGDAEAPLASGRKLSAADEATPSGCRVPPHFGDAVSGITTNGTRKREPQVVRAVELVDVTEGEPLDSCCKHDYSRHCDLAGCAVEGCNCPESKATLLTGEAR